MRRVLSSALVASGLVGLLLGAGSAHAAPAPAPAGDGPAVPAGKKVCTVADDRLRELSGMIATAKGYIVINDSTEASDRKPVFFLDKKCKVTKTVEFPTSPLDPEDLALSPDGKTVWIADIGDNPSATERRAKVALWSMPVSGSSKPVIHRVSYPQGKHHDAEALIVGDDGVPIIVTKTGGKAQIYRPSAPLKKNNETPVQLQKAGEIALPKTTTPNLFAAGGRITVTGAARSPDRTRVALRTYADVFEWDVAGGDIVKALTTGKPRVTPLTDEFGEAVTYTPDGKKFLTVSDAGTLSEETEVRIQSYTPATTLAGAATDADAAKGKEQSWTDKLTLQDINYLIGAVGVIGAILVGVGIFGIVRARRNPPRPLAADGEDGPLPGGPVRGTAQPPGVAAVRPEERDGRPEPGWDAGGFEPAGQGQRAGGVYGAGAAKPAGPIYGAGAPAPAAKPGGVYGGTPGGGYGGARVPSAGGNGAPAPSRGGVYGAAPAAGAARTPDPGMYGGAARRGPAPAGGVYGGQPAGGSYGAGGRADDDRPRGGYPADRRRDDDGYDDSRAGAYRQPQARRGGYPDNGDGYR